LPLGTIATTNVASQCDPTAGWFSYQNGSNTYYMTCIIALVNCPNTQQLNFTYASLSPAGIVPGVTAAKGVVVFFNGSAGTTPGGEGYDAKYFTNGYAIVQMAWDDDWEQSYDPFGAGDTPSIQNAGCRPATFLNFVYTTIFQSVLQANSQAGFCAQGVSAGSAQIVYPMVYYGAGAWLDNVELTSGPVFGDVSQGCQWNPTAANVTVCGQTSGAGSCTNGTTSYQCGCQLGGGSTWSLAPTYLSGPNRSVANWTNDQTCANANNMNQQTTQASMQRWLAQSIADQENITGLGAAPSYSYPSTGMSAWLCRSVYNPNNYDCTNGYNENLCPNNSSPQGQVFYRNIVSTDLPPNYAIYAADQCQGSEGVNGIHSNVPGFYPSVFGGTIQGSLAIQYDMIGYKNNQGVQVVTAQCFRRAH
jgi:hypothetical protein